MSEQQSPQSQPQPHEDQGHGHQHGHGHQPQVPAVEVPAGPEDVDVLVVGGGAAGLAGALSVARARRSVLVVDAGEQRNLPAGAVHNLLTRDGTPPAELARLGREEVTRFGAVVEQGRVTGATPWSHEGTGFAVTVESPDGGTRTVLARRLLVTSGLVDDLPALPGLAEQWGRGVVHCPYCHGYEARDGRVVVLGTNPMAGHAGLLWRQWSAEVTVLLDPAVEIAGPEAERLDARGVETVAGTAAEVVVEGDRVTGVRTTEGEVLPCDFVVIGAPMAARSEVLEQLGAAVVPLEMGGHVFGTHVETTPTGATSVPGVYAAGNVTNLQAQVVTAMAEGTWAGAQVNMELVTEDADKAVAATRAQIFERPAWDERYGGEDHMWSGRVNAALQQEVEHLSPGRALDVGSGEGGDAIWLAQQGWDVTGFEFSATGRARAAEAAAARGLTERTHWRDVDVRTFEAGEERWDLVTSFFVHLPDGGMLDVTRRLAAAVAPGGTLLVVGHHPVDMPAGRGPGRYTHTAEQLVPALDPATWDVHAETRARTAPARDGSGEQVTWHDAILRAVRRA